MTTDETRRNDEIRMTKPATAQSGVFRHSSFGFLSSFLIQRLSLSGNKPEFLYRFVKGLPRLSPLGLCDCSFARSPKLLDGFDAPQRAGPRCPDEFAAHQHIDRIGVKLRKLSKGDPGALIDLNFENQIVNLAIGGNLFAR